MDASDFRRMALSLQGAIESAHMNHPDFRAFGKIFATLNEDETRGMVSLTPEQQEAFLDEHPSMFEPAAGAWGRQGATMVTLSAADEETVGEALTVAWQNKAHAAAATKTKAKKALKKKGSAGQKRRRHRQK